MYRPSTQKRHDKFLEDFLKLFNEATPQTITAKMECKRYIRDGIIKLGRLKLIGFDFEVRDDWARGYFPHPTLGQFERKFDPEKGIDLSIQTSTNGRWVIVAWHNDFQIKREVERKTDFPQKERGIMRATKRFETFDTHGGLGKLKQYLLQGFPVCDYGTPPVPNWINCLPCPLYKEGHCYSQGGKIHSAIYEDDT